MFITLIISIFLQSECGAQGHCGTAVQIDATQGCAICPSTCQKPITPSALVHSHAREKWIFPPQSGHFVSIGFQFQLRKQILLVWTAQQLHCSLISHSPPEALYYWTAFNMIWSRYHSRAFSSSSLVCFDLDIYSIRTDLPIMHNPSWSPFPYTSE